jgi:hypothetical protein
MISIGYENSLLTSKYEYTGTAFFLQAVSKKTIRRENRGRCQDGTKGSEWWIEMCLLEHLYSIGDRHCWAKREVASE